MRSLSLLTFILVGVPATSFAEMDPACQVKIKKLRAQADELEAICGGKSGAGSVAPPQGYGNTSWGMSPKRVKELNPAASTDSSTGWLVARRQVASLDADVSYIFADFELTQVVVIFDEQYSNPNRYHRDYKQVQSLLDEKYGRRVEEKAFWSVDRYRGQPSKIGRAVALGHVTLLTAYETAETRIELICQGRNHRTQVRVSYLSKRLMGKQRAHTRKNDMKGL